MQELYGSIELLQSRLQMIKEMLAIDSGDKIKSELNEEIVDIVEDIREKDYSISNISLKLNDMKLEQAPPLPRKSHILDSGLIPKITNLGSPTLSFNEKEKEKELKQLEVIFSKFEEEEEDNNELEMCNQSTSGSTTIPINRFEQINVFSTLKS